MSPRIRAILQAYADGVNAWITEHNGRPATPFVVAGVLSGTDDIGGYELEPWTPLDTATWQKVQAWSLGGNVDSEIFRLLADAASASRLSPTSCSRPTRTDAGDHPERPCGDGGGWGRRRRSRRGRRGAATARRGIGARRSDAAALADLARPGVDDRRLAGLDGGGGLVGDQRRRLEQLGRLGRAHASGKPILANDPHLGFGMPSIWIMNGLHCRTVGTACPWDVVGVTFPGAPGGRPRPQRADRVGRDERQPGHPGPVPRDARPVRPGATTCTRASRLPYDGAPRDDQGRRRRRRSSSTFGRDRHGPVLSDVDERLKDGPVLALRWTTTAEVDLAARDVLRDQPRDDFDEFRAAFASYGSPSQNFIYADVDGNIGYVLPGLIPMRDGRRRSGDARPRRRPTGAHEWTGYVPREELPWQLDPAAGWIVSANNAAGRRAPTRTGIGNE